jgi:hypothetical protein
MTEQTIEQWEAERNQVLNLTLTREELEDIVYNAITDFEKSSMDYADSLYKIDNIKDGQELVHYMFGDTMGPKSLISIEAVKSMEAKNTVKKHFPRSDE